MIKNEVPKDILPTLVIGLGGTGFQVIKRLKKIFAKRYSGQNLPIRYLIIDTDLKSFLDDSIENNEKCQLRFNEGVKATLDWAYGNDNFDWLPQNPKIIPDYFTATDQGAGLMRPIGRLYLCKNAKLVYDTITTAKNDLVDLYKILTDVGAAYLENIDRNKVYLVGSLAGGTGCGTFLDVSVMLSKIFNRDNTNLIGMFTLESCYDDKLSSDLDAQSRSKANCYAALKELEFYISSIKNPEDERYKFKYNNVGEINLEKKLLDICYLIENKNEIGGVLTNIDDIYDLCSLQLFQEIGTKLGSQLRADYSNFICKDKDPILNRERLFSTFSSSSMEIPVENIKNYCCYKLATDILDNLTSKNISDILLNVEELITKIDNELDVKNYLSNFKGLKLSDSNEQTIKNSRNSLLTIEKRVNEKYDNWKAEEDSNRKIISSLLKNYINENAVDIGLTGLTDLFRALNSRLKERANNLNTWTNATSAADIIKNIDNINSKSKLIRKKVSQEEEEMLSTIRNKINTFVNDKANSLDYSIYSEIAELIQEYSNIELENIDIIKGKVHSYSKDINRLIGRIENQANKSYGGNIISREMVGKDYYYRHYSENYGKILPNIIKEMLEQSNINKVFQNERSLSKGINIISLLKEDITKLLKLCRYKVDKFDGIENVTIMEILRENALVSGLDLTTYIKNEIEIATKLAKPFWSARKSPEVSWTECYYIGSVKDDNITNGITIKPHEEIDTWIRGQTGERSRQARYVETTNPYSIDVIHITMGACAAYLPDVKVYKKFYLKLLATQTYPLHLNESYIGLDDLEVDMEWLFKVYSLAQAYGAILKVQGKYIRNLILDDNYRYLFNSQYCLPVEEVMVGAKMPKNISSLNEEIILGNTEKEVLDNLIEDKEFMSILTKFIKIMEKKLTIEEIKTHKEKYILAYLNSISSDNDEDIATKEKYGDFIAYEKLRYQNSFK